MSSYIPSNTDLKKLCSNGWWALQLIRSTNRTSTAGLGLATLARGIVPAGLAVFAHGLINVFGGPGSVCRVLAWTVPPR